MKRAKKVIVWAAIGCASLTGGIGVLHMPFARSLLMRAGGCPAAYVTPKQVELAREQALRDARGEAKAPHRPALGFPLERASLADVRAWAEAARLACSDALGETTLTCGAVPSASVGELASLPPLDEVTFVFDTTSKVLTGITTFRRRLPASTASVAFSFAEGELRRALGAPTRAEGLSSPRESSTAVLAYAFRDYVASVTATPLSGGVAVRAEYLAVR